MPNTDRRGRPLHDLVACRKAGDEVPSGDARCLYALLVAR